MAIDDFLNHRTSGGRGAYLTGWKKAGKVNTWLHTERLPMAVWRHTRIPKIVVFEDKKTGEAVRHVWSGEWVCHEAESVLVDQYRTDQKGQRTVPPLHCALCRLVDYVRRAVKAGRIDWTKALFRWEADADNSDETVTLHAGPMFMTRRDFDDLDEDEKRVAKAAKLSLRDAWRENCYAKAEYLFCVVDDAHPESGVQKAFNTSSLGDKVKDLIVDRREAVGVEEGDPTQNPYCIQWQFRENESDPKRMYHALAMDKIKLTPTVRKLITGPAPDISRDIQPFNVKEMRAYLEEHCLVKLPWDDIFDVKERERDEVPPESEEEVEQELEEPKPSKGAKKRGAKAEPEREPFPDDEDEHAVACEKCEKAIWDDVRECVHCGAKYDEKFKLVVEEEKERSKGPKKRGAAKPPKEEPKAAKKATRRAAPEPEPEREPGQDDEEDQDRQEGGGGLEQDLENVDPLPFARVERGAVEGWHGSKRPKWERF